MNLTDQGPPGLSDTYTEPATASTHGLGLRLCLRLRLDHGLRHGGLREFLSGDAVRLAIPLSRLQRPSDSLRTKTEKMMKRNKKTPRPVNCARRTVQPHFQPLPCPKLSAVGCRL